MLGGNAAGHAFADSLTMCAPGVKELAVAAGLSLLNWLIIEPYVTGLMFQRYDIEVRRWARRSCQDAACSLAWRPVA